MPFQIKPRLWTATAELAHPQPGPWRTSRTRTRRPGRCSAGSGRRSARAACRRSAGRCASGR
eukprot:14818608-Alexandrium_andersonii.AAC.1